MKKMRTYSANDQRVTDYDGYKIGVVKGESSRANKWTDTLCAVQS